MAKKKILVMDDDKLVLRSVKQLLERVGYDVIGVNSFQEALTALPEHSFNLIISDIRMPEEDGISSITKIRQYYEDRKQAQVPVIFITGYASEDAPIDAIKLGAKDYILKPFDLDELIKSIEKNVL